MKNAFERCVTLAIVTILTLMATPSWSQQYPDFFGWYVQTPSGLQQVEEQAVTFRSGLSGVCGLWGMEGLPREPSVRLSTATPSILVFQQGIDITKVQLGRLTFIDSIEPQRLMKTPPDPQFFQMNCGVPYGVPIPLKLWMLTGTIPVKRGPVQDKAGMYRLEPSAPLSNGVYAVFAGDFVGVARMRDVARKLVAAFVVEGAATSAASQAAPKLEDVALTFEEAVLAEDVRDGEPLGISNRFPSGARAIVCYVRVTGERAGQVMEFVWVQPDGQERGRSSTVLQSPRRGLSQFTFGALRPRTLLQPGRWRVDIYVDGALGKSVDFSVY